MKGSLTCLFVAILLTCHSQSTLSVQKFPYLQKRVTSNDTVYVVNFWASWCKPCVQELPLFDSIASIFKGQGVKVLLVCLDFKEDIPVRTMPLLKMKKIRSECLLLDESNGNDYIDLVDKNWSGAIPATWLVTIGHHEIFEGKTNYETMKRMVSAFIKKNHR